MGSDRDRKRKSSSSKKSSKKGGSASKKRPKDVPTDVAAPLLQDGLVVAAAGDIGLKAPTSTAPVVLNPLYYDHKNPSAPIPIGYKLYAKVKDGSYHPCEILEARLRPGADVTLDTSLTMHSYMYYIHYLQFDRRMDRWIYRDELAVQDELTSSPVITLEEAIQEAMHHSDHYSAEEHRAHEEATRVKNINAIVLGKYEIETWYFSPFPEEFSKFDKLLFCEFCLMYFGQQSELERHISKCTLRHPPGNEIYRSDEHNTRISVFEVDGAKEVLYCQNICLIAKLFLDHKTLQYDTEAFLFYVVTEVDEIGCHVTGYFSKEKEPEQENNLACILTLPCHQRKGYGKFLISLSYELSKIERRAGSPEKPLSDLGRVSYESYWARELLCVLSEKGHDGSQMSIEDLSRMTAILPGDIKATLERLNVIRYESGEHIIKVSKPLLDKYLKKKKLSANCVYVRQCQAEKLHFAPYILTKGRRVVR